MCECANVQMCEFLRGDRFEEFAHSQIRTLNNRGGFDFN